MSKYLFDLNKALAAWRRSLEHNRAFTAEDLDELEQHLRDQVVGLVAAGLTEEAAFAKAMREMGDYGTAEAEYRKVYWGKRRRHGELRHELQWRVVMLKNYMKIAFRNLRRQKGYSFINIAGLTLGLTCCLLLFQYVAFEYSFDQFNEHQDRIYRGSFQITQNEEDKGYQANTAFLFGPTVLEEVPGIVRFARIHPIYGDVVITHEAASGLQTFKETRLFYADSTFLRMFTYPLVQGEVAQALTAPQTLMLSATMARKYFGEEDPIGKTLEVTPSVWNAGTYTVTGVFQDVPATSHLQFDFLLPMQDLLANPQYMQAGAGWGWLNFVTYLETDGRTNTQHLETQVTDVLNRYQGDALAASNTVAHAHLQPLSDIHLNPVIRTSDTVTSDRKTVYFFTLIGLITLVIALVNYINLATARAMDRAREVGVRKVVGAHRHQLTGQFLMESALMNVVALMLAIGLSVLLIPVVNKVADVELTGVLWRDVRFWVALVGVFGFGTLLAGLYPALVLSSFQPVTVLKGKRGLYSARGTLRKGLVIVQFVASIVLIAGTAIVFKQLQFVQRMDIGLNLEQVLVVEGPHVKSQEEVFNAMNTLRNEFLNLPAVADAALSVQIPGRGFNWYTQFIRANADASTGKDTRVTGIDEHFARVYGLTLVAGEPFHEGINGSQDTPEVLVNEAMIRSLGFPSNGAAIGELIGPAGGGGSFVIKGVLKDFNWSSAHQATENVVFSYEPAGRSLSLKVNTEDLPGTLAAMRKTYEALFPGNPFTYGFADDTFEAQYKNDQRFATLFSVFAGIAIVIACLGLFGLAAHTAEQRTKEIGVRKVLGASMGSLISLLTREFVMLVGIAFLLATPVTYFYMDNWLDSFAYHIDLGPGIFLLTGMLALLIALLTVSYQSIKAALADPVKSLRYE